MRHQSPGLHTLALLLPAEANLKTLAATIKARWICEQAHQQLKEELGAQLLRKLTRSRKFALRRTSQRRRSENAVAPPWERSSAFPADAADALNADRNGDQRGDHDLLPVGLHANQDQTAEHGCCDEGAHDRPGHAARSAL